MGVGGWGESKRFSLSLMDHHGPTVRFERTIRYIGFDFYTNTYGRRCGYGRSNTANGDGISAGNSHSVTEKVKFSRCRQFAFKLQYIVNVFPGKRMLLPLSQGLTKIWRRPRVFLEITFFFLKSTRPLR